MQSIEDMVQSAISDMVKTIIDMGAEAGIDCPEDDYYLPEYFDRLSHYIDSDTSLKEQQWWIKESGKAVILMKLANILGITLSKRDRAIMEWFESIYGL